jgi:hypothetical protein
MVADTHERLETAVVTAADLARLNEADRTMLARWLADAVVPATVPPPARWRRLVTLLALVFAVVALIPWIAVLSATLPSTYTSHQWRVVWVGFDVALICALVTTAWTGWRTRQIVISALIVTATLLVCDAWFDTTMSWGTSEQLVSILTAVLGEIPFAIFLVLVAFRLLRALTHHVWHLEGRSGRVPPLRRLPILMPARAAGRLAAARDR